MSMRVAFAIGVGILAGGWAWRSATEGPRRWERIHSLIDANTRKGPREWSDRDRERVWDDLQWFSERAPGEFLERVRSAILDGSPAERERAVELVGDLYLFDDYAPALSTIYLSDVLPSPAHRSRFRVTPLAFDQKLLPDAEVVAKLEQDSNRRVRGFLLRASSRSSPGGEALVRMIRRDPDVELRRLAIQHITWTWPYPDLVDIFGPLEVDPSPRIRLFALAALSNRGHALSFGPFVDLALDPSQSFGPGERNAALTWVAGENVGLRQDSYVFDERSGRAGELSELRERWLNALERMRIGERADLEEE